MALVTVEVADLAAASRELSRSVAEPVFLQVQDALDGVLSGGGMAGDDPAGQQWSTGYDHVAPAAIQAAEDVINSCYRVSTMLAASARNYANAEIASTARGHHVDPGITAAVTTLPDDRQIILPTAGVPSASTGAGSADLPSGWHFIAHHLGGYVWPNGHQDRLRTAAAAWRSSAAALENHAFSAVAVDLQPLLDNLPEGPDISTVCNALEDHLHAVARAHRGLAHACSALAAHIDHAHSQVEHELIELLAETGGIQIIGGVASVFSFGTAEVPTQAAEAARVAATVSKVIEILRAFVAAARVVLAEIGPLAGIVSDVRAAVAWLKDLRIVEVEVSAVPGLRVYQIARVERTGSEAAATTEVAAGEEAGLSNLASEVSTAGSGRSRWTSGKSLRGHFTKHRGDFKYATADEYADGAAAFYERAKAEGLPTKIDEHGDVLIYEPETNTFATYTKAGRTKTFFKPKDGVEYWNEQRGVPK